MEKMDIGSFFPKDNQLPLNKKERLKKIGGKKSSQKPSSLVSKNEKVLIVK